MSKILEAVAVHERFWALPSVTYGAGETILAAGTSTGKLLMLQEGVVEVVRDGASIGTFSEPGIVFGELAALLDQPHSADVRAVEPSTFRVADAGELLRSDPVATLHVAVILARRLDRANRALIEVRQHVAEGKPRGAISRALDRLADAMRYDGDPELAKYMYATWM